MPRSAYLLTVILLLTNWQCTVSFKGTSISPLVENFYVERFDNQALNAPAIIGNLFSEQLRDKMLRETRLTYTDIDPHISFSGAVTRYDVTSEVPTDGEGAAFNRLEIDVQVDYENVVEEKEWSQRFSFFSEFDRSVILDDVQDDLIQEIYDQILEDVFNKAFADW